MKFLFMGNNRLGLEVLGWLLERSEVPAGLVLHPPAKAHLREDMIRLVQGRGVEVFDGSRLEDPLVLERIRGLGCELALSVLFAYVLRRDFLDMFPAGCVNLHPSYLPYNRGAYPNVWSIVEGTPAGATLHYIDEGLDTGDIIARQEVAVQPWDTGKSLYHKLERVALELFTRTWPLLREGRAPRHPQPAGQGSFHRVKDVERIDCIDLKRSYRAGELIDILRARTFPPYPGAYFIHQGKKIYLRLELIKEEDL